MSLQPTRATIMGRFRRRFSRSKPLAPLSAIEKVEQSWRIVSSDIEACGIDFFTRIFLDIPTCVDLFLKILNMDPGDLDAVKGSKDAIQKFVSENKIMRAHARLVIMEVGRCVAGMYDAKILVPRLRSLGRMHGAAGIQAEHYGVFFKHLLATVRDRILETNPRAWDADIEDAWKTVHNCMYQILSQPDEVDRWFYLNRWGYVTGVASIYASIITPLRVAGMIGYGNVVGAKVSFWDWIAPFHSLGMYEILHNFGCAIMDAVVAIIFCTDMIGYVLLRLIKVRHVRRVRRAGSKLWNAGLFGKLVIIIRSLGLQGSVTFPISDVVFIASYFLQYRGFILFGGSGKTCGADPPDYIQKSNNNSLFDKNLDELSFHSSNINVGVHWTWCFGVLRLVALFRAVYVLRCMELTYSVNHRPGSFARISLRISRLVLLLAYTSHVAACLYVLVARVELGPNAVYDEEHFEELETTFFPDYTILGTENGMLTNYLRCVHFAITNLAGIGNHESIPRSALECMFTLCINAVGATLYAFTMGNIFTLLEPSAQRSHRFADEAAELADFMTNIGLTEDEQKKFMQGFILKELVGSNSLDNKGPYGASPGENATAPPYPNELAKNLPRFLQDELRSISLADAMKRRERAFRRCSNDFLAALASSLKKSVVLFPGDYVIREGEEPSTQLLVVEQGALEVVVDGINVRTFERGDVVSFYWITSTNICHTTGRSSPTKIASTCYSPLLLSDAVAIASVRALDHCRVASGFHNISEKKELLRKYPRDWNELEDVLDIARGKKSKISWDNDASDVDRNGNHSGNVESITGSVGKRVGNKSLTRKIRGKVSRSK